MLLGGAWGALNWSLILKFVYQPQTAITDPILGYATGFYLFSLPFYDALQGILLMLSVVGLGVVLSTYFRIDQSRQTLQPRRLDAGTTKWTSLHMNVAAVLIMLAAGRWLARFHLLYSETGIVTGPGWTDVHVRLPALTAIALIQLLLAAILLIPQVRRGTKKRLARFGISERSVAAELSLPIGTAAIVVVVWFLGLGVLPGGLSIPAGGAQ